MKTLIVAILICLIIGADIQPAITGKVEPVYVSVDTFYYNRTDDGMESGTIRVSQYVIDIHHGTYWESYHVESVDYVDGLYVFNTKDSTEVVFDPAMHEMRVGDRTYYINSTIKSNW